MQYFLKGLIGWQVMQRHREEHAALLQEKPKPAPKPYQDEFYRDLASCLVAPADEAAHQDRVQKILFMIENDANFACGAEKLADCLIELIPHLPKERIPRLLVDTMRIVTALAHENRA